MQNSFILQTIDSFNNNVERDISGVRVRRVIPKPKDKLEAGAILYSSWGYEQTNIDFYMIKSIKGKFAMIVHLKSYVGEEDRNMSRLNLPSFEETSEPFKKKIQVYESGGWYIKGIGGSGSLWDGKPKRSTHYA